ncbi:hypothetical protein [Neokomagataea thailandica]|uniref:hypothetical protein n=1 Tax=Neokomagataea TaxID=1223423 RepID=UPI00083440B2|nr:MULTISPECIES: hypothetical protein [Neokomagataea]
MGISSLGGQGVYVHNGTTRMGPDGSGALASSILTLDQALKNACTHSAPSLKPPPALYTPARYMRLN